MTIEITQERLQELKVLLNQWLKKTQMTRKQLESIIGKLSFVSNCVRAGRVFISRLIVALRGLPRFGWHPVTPQIKQDISWWYQFIHHYNGVSILWLEDTYYQTSYSPQMRV